MVVLACRRFPATGRMLAIGHHEVMPLMVRPLDHDAHEAERLELRHLRRIVADNHKLHATGQILGRGIPAAVSTSMPASPKDLANMITSLVVLCRK